MTLIFKLISDQKIERMWTGMKQLSHSLWSSMFNYVIAE